MSTATTKSLLIELGTEELPPKALDELAAAFRAGVCDGLGKRGLMADGVDAKTYCSPRRLALWVADVAAQQPAQKSEVLGPYLNIGLGANGQPTQALNGFAAKNGLAVDALERVTDAKGERFVARSERPGQALSVLLPEIVAEALKALPIPKPMRWGDHDYSFVRPVHWLVMVHGHDVIDGEVLGLSAGRKSRGHRFHHPQPVHIVDADSWLDSLRAAKVLADPAERRQRVREEVARVAKASGGTPRLSDALCDEIANLTEWPVAIACTFDREFLAVPQEALVTTMETNQKFVPVFDANGRLTEHFIGVANIESKDPAEIRKGYERVIRPRFADAKFFFDEDLKQGLESMNAGLANVTYQAKLGSVADKVARVAALAEAIAPQVGVDAALAKRAALLSKADLQSRLVNEFPELQGIAGRYYALRDAALADLSAEDRSAIANAIDEAWQPRFAADDIALSPLGKVLAIAERLDTLAGGFAAGLKPTGNKDPFALRRAALGLARTIIESGFDLDLKTLLLKSSIACWSYEKSSKLSAEAVTLLEGIKGWSLDREVSLSKTIEVDRESLKDLSHEELYDFILDRLRSYYADKGVPAPHFNAVAELKPASLYDFDRRIDAIGTFAQRPEAEALAAANKRIGNILKKADEEIPPIEDRALLREPAESALAEVVEAVAAEANHALAHGDYVDALEHLARLRPQVDAFFDQVMVNVDDDALRRNRLALLRRLRDLFLRVADISLLPAA